MPKTYSNKKSRISLAVEEKLAFASNTKLVRKIKNLPLNFKWMA